MSARRVVVAVVVVVDDDTLHTVAEWDDNIEKAMLSAGLIYKVVDLTKMIVRKHIS